MGKGNEGLDDIENQGIKKVIVSHLGELTKDTRTVGDKIKYRIYYSGILEDETKSSSGIKISDPIDIEITDQLDKGLSYINALNEGKYDQSTHTITWIIKNVSEKTPKPFVEFEAQIGSVDHISNKAIINSIEPLPSEPEFIRETNTVEIAVIPAPKMGWIPFEKDDKLGVMPRVYMKDESTTAITVRFDIPGVFAFEKIVDGVAYQRLSMPGRATLTDIGKPELPIAGEIIEVPFGVDFTPEIIKSETITLKGYNIYPAQAPPRDDANPPQNFVIDKTTYRSDEDYPLALAVAVTV